MREWRPIEEFKGDRFRTTKFLVRRVTTHEGEDGETYRIERYVHVASLAPRRGWWVSNDGFSGMAGGGSCFFLDPPTHWMPLPAPTDSKGGEDV